jgi:site-specific DNA recombinase
MNRLRFASWAAVSTKEQFEKVSIPDQLRINREHAEARGGEVVAELVVPGESRSIVLFEDACARIEAYAQLRDMIATRAFDVLIFRDRTRLGRTVSLVTTVTELCREAGIMLYDVESPPDSLHAAYSYDDQLIGAIKAVGAQREVAEIKRRHMHGMIGRTKKGRLSGQCPFGYKYVYDERGKFTAMVQVEPSATVVRCIFDQYLQGVGTPVIADKLNRDRLLTPTGKTWTRSGVMKIIDNVWKYAGFAEYNRYLWGTRRPSQRPYTRAKGDWKPIVSEEEALRVVEERRQRRNNPYLSDTHTRFAGLCYCGVCGRTMTFSSGGRRPEDGGYEYYYVRCLYHKPSQSCRTKTVTAELEKWLASLPEKAGEYASNDKDPSEPFRLQVAALNAEVVKDKSALMRLDNAFADGALDYSRFKSQVERIRTRIDETYEKIEQLNQEMSAAIERGTDAQRLVDLSLNGLGMLASADLTLSNTYFRHRIRIIVGSGKVERIVFAP